MLGLSARAENVLKAEEIWRIADLVTRSRGDLLHFVNLGKITLREIIDRLADMGLELDTQIENAAPADAPKGTSELEQMGIDPLSAACVGLAVASLDVTLIRAGANAAESLRNGGNASELVRAIVSAMGEAAIARYIARRG